MANEPTAGKHLRWAVVMDQLRDETLRGNVVPHTHRVIRVLEGPDVPIAGVLVALRDSVAVSVDAAVLDDWPGWAYAGAEHIFAPLDMVRRADGHDVLLPWCVERIETYVRQRDQPETPWRAGEIVTLVLSMLRGLAEAEACAEAQRTMRRSEGPHSVAGTWWLTHDGRPLLVLAAADDPVSARDETAHTVEQLLRNNPDRALVRSLEVIRRGLNGERFAPGEIDEWEKDLLSLAAPRPLLRDERGEVAVEGRERVEGKAPAATRSRTRATKQSSWLRTQRRSDIVHHALGAVGAATHRSAELLTSLARTRKPARDAQPRSRKRLVVVAGLAASTVLGAGLLWPAAADEDSAAVGREDTTPAALAPTQATEAGTDAASPRQAKSATELVSEDSNAKTDRDPQRGPDASSKNEGVPDGRASDDPAVAATKLLEGIAACSASGDSVCAIALAPGAIFPDQGIATTGPEASAVTLIDDYGDLAVLRVSALPHSGAEPDASEGKVKLPEQVLVIIRVNDLWLVRDVYDVADQPEGEG